MKDFVLKVGSWSFECTIVLLMFSNLSERASRKSRLFSEKRRRLKFSSCRFARDFLTLLLIAMLFLFSLQELTFRYAAVFWDSIYPSALPAPPAT